MLQKVLYLFNYFLFVFFTNIFLLHMKQRLLKGLNAMVLPFVVIYFSSRMSPLFYSCDSEHIDQNKKTRKPLSGWHQSFSVTSVRCCISRLSC